MKEERRKAPRALAEHLVSDALVGEQGEPDQTGMARAVDLSEGGVSVGDEDDQW